MRCCLLFALWLICALKSFADSQGIHSVWPSVQAHNRTGEFQEGLQLIQNSRRHSLLSHHLVDYLELRQLLLILEQSLDNNDFLDRAKALHARLKNRKGLNLTQVYVPRSPQSARLDNFSLGMHNIALRLDILEKTSFKRLSAAAKKAYAKWGQRKHECYWTAVTTARVNGSLARSHYEWQSDTRMRKKPLTTIPEAIEKGILKPGMVVYVNRKPGLDPHSRRLDLKPHWFTFLGKDEAGEPIFSDQYYVAANFKKMRQWVSGRLIDAFFDPYDR